MDIRIAVASSDGVTVNEHFGRTQVFMIYSLDGKGHRFLEQRVSLPPCRYHEHTPDRLEDAAALISDCRGVVAAQIGSGAVDALLNRRIFAFTMSGSIDEALNVLTENRRFKFIK